jgi:hypothetical protein
VQYILGDDVGIGVTVGIGVGVVDGVVAELPQTLDCSKYGRKLDNRYWHK